MMEWLSASVERLIDEGRERGAPVEFDVVVIGSGYGGAVAALRLAGARKANGAPVSVCVLERGQEYVPGEFPNSIRDMPQHVRVDRHDKEEIYGRPDALFDYRTNPDVDVLVGNALGGGSQINAAVALEADCEIFGRDVWPSAFHGDRNEMDRWYALARRMLGVETYPDSDTRPALAKLRSLEQLADSFRRTPLRPRRYSQLDAFDYVRGVPVDGIPVIRDPRPRQPAAGCPPPDADENAPEPPRPRFAPAFSRLPVAIRFAGRDRFGVRQAPCLQCGDCCSGCNYWAKNTLTMNYLPLARERGAKLYTGAKVIRVEPLAAAGGARWSVEFIRTAAEKEFDTEAVRPRRGRGGSAHEVSFHIHARVVILAAGTLGSTEILLRSRRAGAVEFSPRLGERFSCNGDMIAASYWQDEAVHPIGCGSEDPVARPARTGPMATGLIDFRRDPNVHPRVIIEDGAIPGALGRIFGEVMATAGLLAQLAENGLREDGDTDPIAVSPKAVDRTQIFLMMGDDGAAGRVELRRDDPHGLRTDYRRRGVSVLWENAAGEPVYRMQQTLVEQVRTLGGLPIMSPGWQPFPDALARVLSGSAPEGKVVTVHPLGGCPMGDDATQGAVNHFGQVFDRRGGVHVGLYVCDGAIVPMALAVNPLLTITALAERAMPHLARAEGWTVEDAVNAELPAARPGTRPEPAPEPYRTHGPPPPVGLVLRERLTGHLRAESPGEVEAAFGVRDAPSAGAAGRGPEGRCNLELDLRMEVRDLDAFLRSPKHAADAVAIEGLTVNGRAAPVPRALPSDFRTLVREPSSQQARVYRALCHWWRERGKADGRIGANLFPLLDELLEEGRYGDDRRGLSITRLIANAGRLRRLYAAAGSDPCRPLDVSQVLGIMRVANQIGERRTFDYRIAFRNADGGRYELTGRKLLRYAVVGPEQAHENNNPWRSVARLTDVRLDRVPDAAGERRTTIATGSLELDFVDLFKEKARQPQIVSSTDAPTSIVHLASFGLFYARALFQIYLWAFRLPYDAPKSSEERVRTPPPPPAPDDRGAASVRPRPEPRGRDRSPVCETAPADPERTAPTPWPADVHGLLAPVRYWTDREARRWYRVDAVNEAEARAQAAMLLTRYRGGTGDSPQALRARRPVILIPGFVHSALAFALGTVEENLVQHLSARGFDVWLLDPRTSTALATSWDQCHYDRARDDIPSAVRQALAVLASEESDHRQVDVIAHCMGALMFVIAALGDPGLRSRSGTSLVRRAVLSQLGPVVVASPSGRLRAELAAFLRDGVGLDHVDVRVPDVPESYDTLADRLVSSYPLREDYRRAHRPVQDDGPGSRPGDRPDDRRYRVDALCNRLTALTGHNFAHDNLNERTHMALPQILGNANMTTFLQIAQFAHHERLTDFDGHNEYVTYSGLRDRLDFPIAFVQGEDNDVFDKETSVRSYRLLRVGRMHARGELLSSLTALYGDARRLVPEAFAELDTLLDRIYYTGNVWLETLDRGAGVAGATTQWNGFLGAVARLRSRVAAGTGPGWTAYLAAIDRLTGRLGVLHDRIGPFLAARPGDRHKLVEGYVHFDCMIGSRAHQDVFPYLSGFLTGEEADLEWNRRGRDDVGRPDRGPRPEPLPDREWHAPPRLGPILGWTRVVGSDPGVLIARMWIMVDDHARSRLNDVERALGAVTVDARGIRETRRWPVIEAFEGIALADVEIPLDEAKAGDVSIRFVTRHGADPDPRPGDPGGDQLDEWRISDREDLHPPVSCTYSRTVKVLDEARSTAIVSSSVATALARTDRIAFLFGSCRYPASGFMREQGDAVFARMNQEVAREASGGQPSLLLMLGDQIYYDATAELFDIFTRRSKFVERYTEAFGSPHLRRLMQRVPTYTAIDDHEIWEGWEPAIEYNEQRREAHRLGLEAFRTFQWMHGPCNGLRDQRRRSNGLWYDFEASGFAFFVMDARTERGRDHGDVSCGAASMASEPQLERLFACLKAANLAEPARPKFVASSSILAPMLATSRDATGAIRDDGWAGFPATRSEVLGFIARERIQNVVFLCGDVHVAVVARIAYEGVTALDGSPLVSHCVTASAFYSPYTFINHRRVQFAESGTFAAGRVRASYRAWPGSWLERDGYTRLDVWRDAGDGRWHGEVVAIPADGSTPMRTPFLAAAPA